MAEDMIDAARDNFAVLKPNTARTIGGMWDAAVTLNQTLTGNGDVGSLDVHLVPGVATPACKRKKGEEEEEPPRFIKRRRLMEGQQFYDSDTFNEFVNKAGYTELRMIVQRLQSRRLVTSDIDVNYLTSLDFYPSLLERLDTRMASVDQALVGPSERLVATGTTGTIPAGMLPGRPGENTGLVKTSTGTSRELVLEGQQTVRDAIMYAPYNKQRKDMIDVMGKVMVDLGARKKDTARLRRMAVLESKKSDEGEPVPHIFHDVGLVPSQWFRDFVTVYRHAKSMRRDIYPDFVPLEEKLFVSYGNLNVIDERGESTPTVFGSVSSDVNYHLVRFASMMGCAVYDQKATAQTPQMTERVTDVELLVNFALSAAQVANKSFVETRARDMGHIYEKGGEKAVRATLMDPDNDVPDANSVRDLYAEYLTNPRVVLNDAAKRLLLMRQIKFIIRNVLVLSEERGGKPVNLGGMLRSVYTRVDTPGKTGVPPMVTAIMMQNVMPVTDLLAKVALCDANPVDRERLNKLTSDPRLLSPLGRLLNLDASCSAEISGLAKKQALYLDQNTPSGVGGWSGRHAHNVPAAVNADSLGKLAGVAYAYAYILMAALNVKAVEMATRIKRASERGHTEEDFLLTAVGHVIDRCLLVKEDVTRPTKKSVVGSVSTLEAFPGLLVFGVLGYPNPDMVTPRPPQLAARSTRQDRSSSSESESEEEESGEMPQSMSRLPRPTLPTKMATQLYSDLFGVATMRGSTHADDLPKMAKPAFFDGNAVRMAFFNLFGAYVRDLPLMPKLSEDNTSLNPELVSTSTNLKLASDTTHFVDCGIRRVPDLRRDSLAAAHYTETRMITAGYVNTVQTQILDGTYFTQKGLVRYFTDFEQDQRDYNARLITLDTNTPLGFLLLPVGYMVKAELLEIPPVPRKHKEKKEKRPPKPLAIHLRDALTSAAYATVMDENSALYKLIVGQPTTTEPAAIGKDIPPTLH